MHLNVRMVQNQSSSACKEIKIVPPVCMDTLTRFKREPTYANHDDDFKDKTKIAHGCGVVFNPKADHVLRALHIARRIKVKLELNECKVVQVCIVHNKIGKPVGECDDSGTIFMSKEPGSYITTAEMLVGLANDNVARDEWRHKSFEFWKSHCDAIDVYTDIIEKTLNKEEEKGLSEFFG